MSTIGPCPPDEPSEQYLRMLVDTAPSLSPELAFRLARLLPPPRGTLLAEQADPGGAGGRS